jgi:hypothetical protein
MEKEKVVLGKWIWVGKNEAVVSHINEGELPAIGVVYMHSSGPLYNCIIWSEDRWIFDPSGGGGSDTKNKPWLTEFVIQLKRGRHYQPGQ